jgi:hypothetical protein
MVFSIKVCGSCISSCKVQVCWRCMDRGLIVIIKLHERGLIEAVVVKFSERWLKEMLVV